MTKQQPKKKSQKPQDNKVKPSGAKLRLIVFGTTWCAPCKAQMKTLEKFGPAHPELELEHIELDETKNEGKDKKVLGFEVEGVPTLALLRGKQVIEHRVGMQSARELEKWIGKAQASSKVG